MRGSARALAPKARRVLDPSMVRSEEFRLASAEPGAVVEAGVSSKNSCQRRPLAGSACTSAALMVEETAGVAGSGFSTAAMIGVTCGVPTRSTASMPSTAMG